MKPHHARVGQGLDTPAQQVASQGLGLLGIGLDGLLPHPM